VLKLDFTESKRAKAKNAMLEVIFLLVEDLGKSWEVLKPLVEASRLPPCS
jgi:hypothetical protein